jgi:hypothetical protein
MPRKSPATTVDSQERQRRAVNLRRDGHSYESIARICGYASRSGAFKAVNDALAAQESEAVESLRKVDNARLEKLLRVHLRLATKEGDHESGQLVLGALRERAKLNGLYAPVETKLSGGLGVTLDAIDEARAAARANDPACSTPAPSPTSPDATSTSGPGSSPTG